MRTYGRKAKSSISAAAARTADPIGAAPSSSIERAVLQLRGVRALEVEGQQAAPHVRSLAKRVFDMARALALTRRSGGSARRRARRSRPPQPCRVRGAPRACTGSWTWPQRAPRPEHVDEQLRLDAARGGGAAGGAAATARGERARRDGGRGADPAAGAGGRRGRTEIVQNTRREDRCRGWSALQRAVEEEERSSLRQLAAARDP